METGRAIEILLAEDSAFDAEMTIRTLKKHNVLNPLHWVKDGQEALDFLFCEGAYENRKGAPLPKLILLDISMPKVNGLDVLQRLKAHRSLRRIPIVMMTSSAEVADVAKANSFGANSYIVKPIEFDHYEAAVAKLGIYWTKINYPAQG